MKEIVSALAGLCLALIAVSVFPQDMQANNRDCGCWYVGAGVGYSNSHIDDTVTPIPGVTYTLSDDDNDWGGKIFAGYQWNPNFAIEGGYVDFGQGSQTLTTVNPAVGSLNADFKSRGVFLDAIGIVPIGKDFSVDGKVGGYYAHNSLDFSATGPIASFVPGAFTATEVPINEYKNELKWEAGLGARYDFTKNIGVRAEWERYFDQDTDHSGGGTNIDLYSVNLIYSF